MPINVDAYTVGGKASGTLTRPGHLREILEQTGELALHDVRWQPLGAPGAQPAGDLTIAIDDVLVAVTDDESAIPVHASWHALRIEVGPYVVEGELPTLPGYDPDRALARPNGEFVLLRDPRLGRVGDAVGPIGREALVNRYGVERVEADIMLGFFFPGAVMPTEREVSAPGPARSSAAARSPSAPVAESPSAPVAESPSAAPAEAPSAPAAEPAVAPAEQAGPETTAF
jgi:hypothetical protein